ncbi:MAG TPA: DUF3168 domain-containing protein [Noviherbaspirillum sp.]|jgi:hypothetical protein|uniref:DUF3168 domain-containing protein n=1 Tax=Noviherbaspirillum sp. TaxID=1926288 RepID=UPI002F923BFE
MSVEKAIREALLAICPRVFYDFAPVETERPYVTLQQIGGQAVSFVDDAVPELQNGEFQINVWADKRTEASALAVQIEAALIQADAFEARPSAAPASDFDPDVPVYGTRQDFSIWSNR